MQVEGQRTESLLSVPATGARVSNTYATCPGLGDNPAKVGLNPRISGVGIHFGGKELAPGRDGHAAH